MQNFTPIVPLPKKVVFLEGENTNPTVKYFADESLSAEGYKLDIGLDCVRIAYANFAGKQYAEESLRQLKNYYCKSLPCLHIEDSPNFAYRGFMLDVGRYFYSIEDVKTIIDDMFALKYNVLHLHLTEDQGWRIESEKYPLLTKEASSRSHTNFNHTPHGGFYTKQQLKDVVDYAHGKAIKVVPEIDMPGHMRAALAAYPNLGCFNRKLEVATHWGVKHDILCAGKPDAYKFIGDLIDELAEIFTDGIFHLGGDEAVKTRWKLCPNCQRAIKENGLTCEDDLQTFFINKITRDFLKPKGIRAMLWAEEHIPKGLDSDVILQWYSNKVDDEYEKQGAIGRSVVNSNSDFYYLDFPYSKTGLDKSYGYNPQTALKNGLIGGEVCLWTEYVPNLDKALYMSFPRAAAAAERFWGSEDNFKNFVFRANTFYSSVNSDKFCPLAKSCPKHFKFFRSFFWNYIRQLHWEGVKNLIDNNKVKKLAAKQAKKG